MMKKILTKNYLSVRRWRNTVKGYYEDLIPLGKRTFHFRHILLHCSFQVNLINVNDKIDGIGILSNPTCNSVNEMSISPLLLSVDEARVIIIIIYVSYMFYITNTLTYFHYTFQNYTFLVWKNLTTPDSN
jgi:hypothetical protein